jgi:hypothetical protein
MTTPKENQFFEIMDDGLLWNVDSSRPTSARQEIERFSSAQRSYLNGKKKRKRVRKGQKKV